MPLPKCIYLRKKYIYPKALIQFFLYLSLSISLLSFDSKSMKNQAFFDVTIVSITFKIKFIKYFMGYICHNLVIPIYVRINSPFIYLLPTTLPDQSFAFTLLFGLKTFKAHYCPQRMSQPVIQMPLQPVPTLVTDTAKSSQTG